MLDFDVPFHLVTWMATAIFDCLPPWLLGPWHLWGVWHHFLLHFIHEMLWCFLMLPCGVVSGVKDRSEQKNSQGRSARPSRALRAPSAGRLEVFALLFFCFFVFLRFFPKHVFSHFFSPPFSVWFFFLGGVLSSWPRLCKDSFKKWTEESKESKEWKNQRMWKMWKW